MKKHILSGIALCGLSLFCTRSFAQKGFNIGIRYMVQKSYLFNDNDKNEGPALDKESTWSYLSGGLALGYGFSEHVGLELDVLRSRQGQKYTGTNPSSGSADAYSAQVAVQEMANGETGPNAYQAKAELNFTQLPLLLKLSTSQKRNLNFNFVVGPQLNILNNAVYELNGEDVELPGTGIEPTDAYKKTTIDGIAGVGIGYKLSTHWAVSGQVRFDYGFQDVEKKDVMYSSSGTSMDYYGSGRASTHNGATQLMVGFNYQL